MLNYYEKDLYPESSSISSTFDADIADGEHVVVVVRLQCYDTERPLTGVPDQSKYKNGFQPDRLCGLVTATCTVQLENNAKIRVQSYG